MNLEFDRPPHSPATPVAPCRNLARTHDAMGSIVGIAVLGCMVWVTAAVAQTGGGPSEGVSVGSVSMVRDSLSYSMPPANTPGSLADYWVRGGLFMYPIGLCSLAALATVIERLIALRKARSNAKRFMGQVLDQLRQGGVAAAREVCRDTQGPLAAVIQSGLAKAEQGPEAVEKAIEAAGGVEIAFLQRGLMVLSTVANIAPLLGFLGTVSGMINAFEAIAAAEQVSPKIVAGGISEALITTLAGLVVAIPAQLFHNYFLSRVDRFIGEMEESSIELITALEDERRVGR